MLFSDGLNPGTGQGLSSSRLSVASRSSFPRKGIMARSTSGWIAIAAVVAAVYIFSGSSNPTPAPIDQPAAALPVIPLTSAPPRQTVTTPTAAPTAKQPPLNIQPLAQKREPTPAVRSNTARSVISAAAITAMIVSESRNTYYATGKPCACPDDVTRSGRRCGGNSAYSRAGGANVYCSASDVPSALIEKRRASLGASAVAR